MQSLAFLLGASLRLILYDLVHTASTHGGCVPCPLLTPQAYLLQSIAIQGLLGPSTTFMLTVYYMPMLNTSPAWHQHQTHVQMDEEDLYSAVARQAHAAGSDEQDAGQEDDSLNADTFGSATVSAANNGTGPARPAWSSAGASVALVAGSNRWAAVAIVVATALCCQCQC